MHENTQEAETPPHTDTPKSGAVELQMAPMLDTASMVSMATELLGRYPTTLSPTPTPQALRAEAVRATRVFSWEKVIVVILCPSPELKQNWMNLGYSGTS